MIRFTWSGVSMKSVMALIILTGGASLAAAGFLEAAQPAQALAKSIKDC